MKKVRIAVPLALGMLTVGLLWASSASAIHPVPNGANPVRVPIVPAMAECTVGASIAGNHGPPLPVTNSCTNPDTVSSTVTLGTSPATYARLGQTRIIVCPVSTSPGCGAVGAYPDVRLFGNNSDVVCKSGASLLACPSGAGSDYDPNPAPHPQYTAGLDAPTNSNTTPPSPLCGAGGACSAGAEMTAIATIPGSTSPVGQAIRITDHYNATPSTGDPPGCGNGVPYNAGESCSGTVIDAPFPVPVVCSATSDATIGSYCGTNTTANALIPGVVISGNLSVIQVGQIRILDAGPDGDPTTATDNQVAGVQGILIP